MFLYMYGVPAIEKLQRQSTIVIKTRNHTNGIEAPSITISARNNQTGIGWRKRPAKGRATKIWFYINVNDLILSRNA